jgi:hypothetical protein
MNKWLSMKWDISGIDFRIPYKYIAQIIDILLARIYKHFYPETF